jgi:DNA-binding NarL/FixJ family response regulator
VSALAASGEADRPRVLIAADNAATRTGVRLALGQTADCFEADDDERVAEVALRDHADVCFLVFDPPGRGIQATAAIRAAAPWTQVVVMTRRIDAEECLAAVRAGAAGYLSQAIDPARLSHVVDGLLHGEAAIPRRLVRGLIDEVRGRDRRRRLELPERRQVELTAREADVVEALCHGMSTRQIADLLGISQVTVRRHLSAVAHKVDARTRAELLRLLDDRT